MCMWLTCGPLVELLVELSASVFFLCPASNELGPQRNAHPNTESPHCRPFLVSHRRHVGGLCLFINM